MTHYEFRRQELIGDRIRKPKYNAPSTLAAYTQKREELLRRERARSAMTRLARVFL